MKKILSTLVALALVPIMLVGCGEAPTSEQPTSQAQSQEVSDTSSGQASSEAQKTKYTVTLMSEGARFQTLKIEEGSLITGANTPRKDGYNFEAWLDEENHPVDLLTFTVSENVTLTASFKKIEIDDGLSVHDVKEEGKSYYLVVGWWETTEEGKTTSSLTDDTVKLFYGNLKTYLTKYGASEDNLKKISFRDYSSEKVADMGASVNADGDVDLMIGVGNNINSTANVSLYEGNDGKFATLMGTTPLSRYVALVNHETMSPVAINVFDWLKTTEGAQAFLKQLTADEMVVAPERTDAVDLTVTIHGDTDAVTKLETKDDVITMPEITVQEGYNFLGFATSSEATEAELNAAKDAELKYKDVEKLVAEGATTLDLYPVIAEPVVSEYDLTVFIQVNSSLTKPEAELLKARYLSTQDADFNMRFEIVEGNADALTDALVGQNADIVIGGNNPVNNYAKHEDGPTANCGAKHFESENRKVIITATTSNLENAKAFYKFVTAEAPEYQLNVAFWAKGGDWITEEELSGIKSGIRASLNELYKVGESTLKEKYNVSVLDYDVEGTKVGPLGEATNALVNGAGPDLVVGCGANITTGGGVEVIEKKEIPTTMVAANRQVAIRTANPLAQHIYDNYFVVAEVPAE